MFPAPWTVDVLALKRDDDGNPLTDDYGNKVEAFDPPRPEPVYGWAPAGSTEMTGWTSQVTADLQLYAPPTFKATPQDHVVVDGRTYAIEGAVQDFNHGPFGFTPGVVVNLRRVTG